MKENLHNIYYKMITEIKRYCLIFATIILLTGTFIGCQKTLEAYVGFPLQPTNINSVYEPGLNIFGIVKTGATYDTINHFFEVHNMLYIFDTVTPLVVDEAEISLWEIDENNIGTEYNLRSIGNGRYTHNFLLPMPGELWQYECAYDTFLVIAETRIPNTPVVNTESIELESRQISFTIEKDTTAFIYDVFFIYNNDFEFKRVVPVRGTDTNVSLSFKNDLNNAGSMLFVYAYDRNYEQYITTSNIFFKPNAYRPRYSTVVGGYGCFCSASSVKLEFQ